MKTFVQISMLTWETAATAADNGIPTEGFAERVDASDVRSMDCSVRSDLDWIREHDGFAASIVRLSVDPRP